MVGIIGTTGAMAIPLIWAIRRQVAVCITVRVDIGIDVRRAVAVGFISAVVVAEVIQTTCVVGRAGAIHVASADCMVAANGVAMAAYRAVAGLRGGGDEPPVLARAPAAGRVQNGGPVVRHQAEQGKQQASHAIHLLVGDLVATAMGG